MFNSSCRIAKDLESFPKNNPAKRLRDKSILMETAAFVDFIRLVVAGELEKVSRLLGADPALATMPSPAGATRRDARTFFFTRIRHCLYSGDTALHMAAAAFDRPMAELLVTHC